MSKMTDLMTGAVGYFWTDVDEVMALDRAMPGHVHLSADGDLQIDLLVPNADPFGDVPLPSSVAATTSVGGALFLDVGHGRLATTHGGYRVATRTYRAHGVVTGAPLRDLRSDGFRDVSAFFPGIARWAGVAGSSTAPAKGEDGRLTSLAITVQAAEARAQDLGKGRQLELSTHWQVDGPEDRRTIYAPVEFKVSASRPASWSDLIPPLQSIQGLLSLAYDGLVVADGGRVTMDTDRPPMESPKWWTARIMRRPDGARAPRSMTEIPNFHLSTIGGIAGLRRWIDLTDKHPRATGPLLAGHRYGLQNVETRLMEIAAAIEYWVSAHRRSAQWARKSQGQGRFAANLAARVGAPFGDLVGDPMAWARRFWKTYTLLKHEPNSEYDAYEVSLLAATGAVLLQSALLNRVAGTSAPARAICDSHRYYHLGAQTRGLLGA
ncbi:ApeA N-terminal domain 1-containing protein [Isoptericola rhizosphaerae]|uniref:ApeA N-terminal domain 1-containing protein n=1 Tax=Isoptericola rhizosphaerae TaxID=3377837 RepID=UPI00383A0DAB